MTIAANERAFFLNDGEQYEITIISKDADELDYHNPTTARHITATAQGGALRFETVFEREQEHEVIFHKSEKKKVSMRVYSLYEDLYALTPMKGDLHAHSYRSDGQVDPAALAGHFREMGYDFFALTDHNRYYPGGEIDEAYEGVEKTLFRVLGEEVHTPGSLLHIVHVGGKSSVAEIYCREGERYEREVEECMTRVPESVPEQYRDRYAMAMWATEKIHEAGGLAIFPHPFWRPGGSRIHNICEELARIYLKSGMFDAFELLGGMGQEGCNRALAVWQEVCAEGYKIPVVGSSDVHNLRDTSTFPTLFTICFADSRDNDGVKRAIKCGNSVAVEACGEEYGLHHRCYGSHRLVAYAQFLLRTYFHEMRRLCQGEGIAMRAYAMEDTSAQLIELNAQLCKKMTDRFFGREQMPLPSERLLAFEDKWRAVQLDGPLTKGGIITAPPITRQI
jgi:hypothetical protein